MATGSQLSSLDPGYQSGDLSLFPTAYDTDTQLYRTANNANAVLKHGLTYNGTQIIVEDASAFPTQGLIRLSIPNQGNPELVFYATRTNTVFSGLIRGFAGSRQSNWPGQTTSVSASVMAEHHNAVKDAILKIEGDVGTSVSPTPTSLNGILTALENTYLAPRPFFKAFPLKGPPGLIVTFQNFSEGDAIRFLWDFGDGSKSIERNPFHQYAQEGIYTVQLNIITKTGAQGIAVKSNYVTINVEERTPFFYVAENNTGPNYSIETAANLNVQPQSFEFVDQTDGDIVQRYWVFDDGTNASVTDPDVHTISHEYQSPGVYSPSLLIIFGDQNLKRVYLSGNITVI